MKRLVFLAALAACGGSPAEPAEPLETPAARPRPVEPTPAGAPAAAPINEAPCRTNFFADPPRGKRHGREARTLTTEADQALVAAESGEAGAARQDRVVGAMDLLINALARDPFAPEPTYKLAVAYALVGHKACSLALLERLRALTGMAEVQAEAARTVQRAVRDPAFEPWRTEARRVLGQ